MIFKKNNPGCPCCCPCACFKFDSDLKSSSSSHEFTASGTNSFSSGKLDNALEVSHHSTPSTNALTLPHNSCFSLEGGLSFWFWLYTEPDCTETSSVTSYFLSKGGYYPSATAQWAVAIPFNKQCNASTNIQYAAAIKKSTGGHQIMFYDDPAVETPQRDESGNVVGFPNWTFYFHYYDPDVTANGTFYTSINGAGFFTGGATGPGDDYDPSVHLTAGGTALDAPIESNDEPLKLFEFVSAQAGSVRIDNLGFCKNIPSALSDGTTTEQQMAARAAALYNSGTGKACNEWK
tara:strand:- start:451 stop:1323 length:873 start_codon:yes stop_codon:yes gene_type:complete